MKVEIWSDIMCPFCYIGKRKFEQALQQFDGNDKVQIEWKSFLLDPSMKAVKGKNIHEVLADKKGWTIDYARKMNQYVTQMAQEVGLHFEFDKMVPANSFDAHRLTHLAAKHGLQDQVEEKLFEAYFIQGKDIADKNTLTGIGTAVGLKQGDVLGMLASDAFADEVKSDVYEAEQLGVRGVPFFVFDRKYAVSGAQPTEVFSEAINSAWNEFKKVNPAAMNDENSCQLDGNC